MQSCGSSSTVTPTDITLPRVTPGDLEPFEGMLVRLHQTATVTEHFQLGRGGQPLSASNTLRGGDTVTDPVGVLTFTFGGNAASPNAYRLRPVGALGGTAVFDPANPRPVAPPAVGTGGITVANANLLNFFNTFTGCTFGLGGARAQRQGRPRHLGVRQPRRRHRRDQRRGHRRDQERAALPDGEGHPGGGRHLRRPGR